MHTSVARLDYVFHRILGGLICFICFSGYTAASEEEIPVDWPGSKILEEIPFRPGKAPGGLGTPKINHEPYIRTNVFQVSSDSIVIGPFSSCFSVRGVGGPYGR